MKPDDTLCRLCGKPVTLVNERAYHVHDDCAVERTREIIERVTPRTDGDGKK